MIADLAAAVVLSDLGSVVAGRPVTMGGFRAAGTLAATGTELERLATLLGVLESLGIVPYVFGGKDELVEAVVVLGTERPPLRGARSILRDPFVGGMDFEDFFDGSSCSLAMLIHTILLADVATFLSVDAVRIGGRLTRTRLCLKLIDTLAQSIDDAFIKVCASFEFADTQAQSSILPSEQLLGTGHGGRVRVFCRSRHRY